MPSTKNNTSKSLFMFSSIEKRLGETAKRLSFLARQAYVNRDFETLKNNYERLLNCGASSVDAGLLFKALYDSSFRKVESSVIESLAGSKDPVICAASILMLSRIVYRKGNDAEAQKLILSANKIALSRNMCAPLIALNAQNVYSAILSDHGDHKESQRILERNMPLANAIGQYFPATQGEILNNYAFESLKLGNYDVALYFINKALALPVSPYFEWFETKQEIDQKIYEKNYRKLISLSDYSRARLAVNVSQITSKQTFYICFDYHNTRYKLLNFIIDNSDESDSRFTSLILSLQSICTNICTGIKISAFFSPVSDQDSQFSGYLESSRIDDFLAVVANIKSFEDENPLKEYGDELAEEIDASKCLQIIQWVKSFVDDGLEIPTFEGNQK